MTSAKILVRCVTEVAISIWIVELPMFCKRLREISTLHAMQQNVSTVVRAIQKIARRIEVETPRITSTLAKQFEFLVWRFGELFNSENS